VKWREGVKYNLSESKPETILIYAQNKKLNKDDGQGIPIR
jgi:hypothetical protein